MTSNQLTTSSGRVLATFFALLDQQLCVLSVAQNTPELQRRHARCVVPALFSTNPAHVKMLNQYHTAVWKQHDHIRRNNTDTHMRSSGHPDRSRDDLLIFSSQIIYPAAGEGLLQSTSVPLLLKNL
jgi:hypothetical protein